MRYWLMKSEPQAYSWSKLVADGRGNWDGVRNHQAKNNLMAMKLGDLASEIGCDLEGDPGVEISGLAPIDDAGPTEITFVANEQKAYKIPDDTKIIMTVASPAQPGSKILPTRDRAMSVGALAGVVALAGVIALVETFGAIRRKR